ncbi:MAG TPA: serine hydrolase [Gemmatimonadaceae bacterium]
MGEFISLALTLGLTVGQPAPDSVSDRMENTIRVLIASQCSATVAVSYRDLGTGRSFDIAGDSVFHAASTMKIPVMIEVLKRAQDGAFSLDQEILLVNQFASLADGSPFSLNKDDDGDSVLYGKVGERVAIRELLQRMITRSSNLATNQLIELVGAANVTATARELGAKHLSVLRGVEDQKAFDKGMVNTTTSADLATLLSLIEKGNVLSGASSAEMRTILLAQEFNEKIPAGLPKGTKVAHKTGEITAVSHDAAIIYPSGKKPYVLVVLTKGIRDPAASSSLIAAISRTIWMLSGYGSFD